MAETTPKSHSQKSAPSWARPRWGSESRRAWAKNWASLRSWKRRENSSSANSLSLMSRKWRTQKIRKINLFKNWRTSNQSLGWRRDSNLMTLEPRPSRSSMPSQWAAKLTIFKMSFSTTVDSSSQNSGPRSCPTRSVFRSYLVKLKSCQKIQTFTLPAWRKRKIRRKSSHVWWKWWASRPLNFLTLFLNTRST